MPRAVFAGQRQPGNWSDVDPLVILKHFGPGNPDAEIFRKK